MLITSKYQLYAIVSCLFYMWNYTYFNLLRQPMTDKIIIIIIANNGKIVDDNILLHKRV